MSQFKLLLIKLFKASNTEKQQQMKRKIKLIEKSGMVKKQNSLRQKLTKIKEQAKSDTQEVIYEHMQLSDKHAYRSKMREYNIEHIQNTIVHIDKKKPPEFIIKQTKIETYRKADSVQR